MSNCDYIFSCLENFKGENGCNFTKYSVVYSSIVIAPARTGKDSSSKIIVNIIAQTNNGIRSSCVPVEHDRNKVRTC